MGSLIVEEVVMGSLRKFLGLKDIEYIALHHIFHGNVEAVLVSPVALKDCWPLLIEAPEHQINFLHPLIKKMQKNSPLSPEGEGWVGVIHPNATCLNLFYAYGDPKPKRSDTLVTITDRNIKRIELLQSKFRSDAAKYADIKFSKTAVIEVVWEDKVAISDRVTLPENFENGSITLPALWLQ